MKHGWKIFTVGLICGLVASLFVACGPNLDASVEDTPTNEDPAQIATTPAEHNHTYGEWVVIKEPGCTTDGLEKRICLDCDEFETRAIPALGHDYPTNGVEHAPTCTETGYIEYTCTCCGHQKRIETEPAYGHSEPEEITVTEPTSTTPGKANLICPICHEKLGEKELPATGTTTEPVADEPGNSGDTQNSGETTEPENPESTTVTLETLSHSLWKYRIVYLYFINATDYATYQFKNGTLTKLAGDEYRGQYETTNGSIILRNALNNDSNILVFNAEAQTLSNFIYTSSTGSANYTLTFDKYEVNL